MQAPKIYENKRFKHCLVLDTLNPAGDSERSYKYST